MQWLKLEQNIFFWGNDLLASAVGSAGILASGLPNFLKILGILALLLYFYHHKTKSPPQLLAIGIRSDPPHLTLKTTQKTFSAKILGSTWVTRYFILLNLRTLPGKKIQFCIFQTDLPLSEFKQLTRFLLAYKL